MNALSRNPIRFSVLAVVGRLEVASCPKEFEDHQDTSMNHFDSLFSSSDLYRFLIRKQFAEYLRWIISSLRQYLPVYSNANVILIDFDDLFSHSRILGRLENAIFSYEPIKLCFYWQLNLNSEFSENRVKQLWSNKLFSRERMFEYFALNIFCFVDAAVEDHKTFSREAFLAFSQRVTCPSKHSQ